MAATIVQYLGTGRRKRSVARVILTARQGRDSRSTAAHSRIISPRKAARAMVRQPLAATETAEKFDLADSRRWRRRGRPGGRRPSWHRPGTWWSSTSNCGAALEEARLPHSRPARARTEEVRSKGRPQAVPVLQALISRRQGKGPGPSPACWFHALPFRSRRKSRFGPRAAGHCGRQTGGLAPTLTRR